MSARVLALWLAMGSLASCTGSPASAAGGTFVAKALELRGTTHRYAVWLPPGYEARREWPLVVFLNGMGECGSDGEAQLTVGLGPVLRERPGDWPCLVLLPQKPDQASQWEQHEQMLIAQVHATLAEYSVATERIALTGLSQGGHGTFALAARYPQVWSAAAPVCGYGDPAELAQSLVKMPLWAFHGEDDPTVPVAQSRALCAAIERAGGKPRLTTYPGVKHNSWDRAYREEGLPVWLLSHRSSPPRPFRF